MVYFAIWPAPVVFAENVALVKVYGVFVMIFTATLPAPTLSLDKMLRLGSVILNSNLSVGLVVGGF